MDVLCVAGEASGDRLLAPVVAALVTAGHRPVGLGGPLSVAAGLTTVTPFEGLAAHGLVEAMASVPEWAKAFLRLRRLVNEVGAAVLVDFPELNMRLLSRLSRVGCPTAYLAPPQVWAWRPWRTRALKRARVVGCLFSFEAEFLSARGVETVLMAHPLAAAPCPGPSRGVALLPGSRAPTVARLLPIMLAAARTLVMDRPGLPVTLGLASPALQAVVDPLIQAGGVQVKVVLGAEAALAASHVALVGVGTATLQAALAGRPFVALARLHPLSEAVARRLVKAPHLALPNLVLGRRVFPECVLEGCTSAAVARAAGPLVDAPERWSKALADVRHRCEVRARGGSAAQLLGGLGLAG